MIDSGVDIVAGVRGSLLVRIFNRLMACELSAYDMSIGEVEFAPGEADGSVSLKIRFNLMDSFLAEVVYELAADVADGKLVVNISEESVPELLREHLVGVVEGSPYEIGLGGLTEWVIVRRLGVKVGGGGDLLLVGVELGEESGADWSRFYNTYTGTDLLSDSDLWGVYAKKHFLNELIRQVFSDALGEGEMDGVEGVEITNIEWPGDRIDISLKGTYTDCDIFSEIDFRAHADVTFPIEGSKVFAEARVHNIWLPEEDLIQMGICSLSNMDIVASLLTGFVYLIGKIVTDLMNVEDEVIKKELINMRFPEVDSIRINSANAVTTGVVVRGGGPSEVGEGRLYLWDGRNVGKISLTESIKVPLGYVGRPYGSIFRRVLLQNHGDASLFIYSAEIEHHYDTSQGAFQILHTDSDEGCFGPYQEFRLGEKMILLPKEGPLDEFSRTYLKLCFNPTDHTEYDTLYEGTLVLRTLVVVADSLGDVEYVPVEERVELTAEYSWYNVDMQVIEPHFFIDKGTILVDAYLDKPVVDVFDMGPWADLPLPEGTIRTAEVFTVDPRVSSLRVNDGGGVTVAEDAGTLPYRHVSFIVGDGAGFNLLVEGERVVETDELRREAKNTMSRTLLTVVGHAYVPEARIEPGGAVKNMFLRSGRLYVGLEGEMLVYDLSGADKPVLLSRRRIADSLSSFSVLTGQPRNRLGEVVCVTDSGVSFFDEEPYGGKAALTPRRSPVRFKEAEPIKVEAAGSRCVVFDGEGFAVYGVGVSGTVTEASRVRAAQKVYDGEAGGDTVVLGTEGGIEVYSISEGTPRLLARYESDEPVQSVEVKKPYIYAGSEGKGVTLLEFNEPGKLKKAGHRSWAYHELKALNDGDRYVKLSDDGKTILVYRERALPPDFTKYRRRGEDASNIRIENDSPNVKKNDAGRRVSLNTHRPREKTG